MAWGICLLFVEWESRPTSQIIVQVFPRFFYAKLQTANRRGTVRQANNFIMKEEVKIEIGKQIISNSTTFRKGSKIIDAKASNVSILNVRKINESNLELDNLEFTGVADIETLINGNDKFTEKQVNIEGYAKIEKSTKVTITNPVKIR